MHLQQRRLHSAMVHRMAIEVAEDEKEFFRDSLPQSLIDESVATTANQDCIAPFREYEIVLGPKLGSGEFSHVYEVHSFNIQAAIFNQHRQDDHSNPSDPSDELTTSEIDKRLHMKKIQQYRNTGKARYALKHIKEQYLHDHGMDAYVQTAGDLALEAEFLAHLSHPNIIKLRGITHNGAAGFANGPQGFFLVIDRLFETLGQRIKYWHQHNGAGGSAGNKKSRRMGSQFSKAFSNGMNKVLHISQHKSRSGMLKMKHGQEEVEVELSTTSSTNTTTAENVVDTCHSGFLDECLHVALQISAAMTYLHSHSIIFRDLKPDNIGFDVRGDVKIFDFGLARIMPQDGGNPYLDTYEMSGAGSPRYMSPECLTGDVYNLKADVYTFAIVLWQMLTGETPYSFVRTRDQLLKYVIEDGGRPEIEDDGPHNQQHWPTIVKRMMKNSFDANLENRPKMINFHNTIQKALTTLRGGDNTGLTTSVINRRRSHGSAHDSFTSAKVLNNVIDTDALSTSGRITRFSRLR